MTTIIRAIFIAASSEYYQLLQEVTFQEGHINGVSWVSPVSNPRIREYHKREYYYTKVHGKDIVDGCRFLEVMGDENKKGNLLCIEIYEPDHGQKETEQCK